MSTTLSYILTLTITAMLISGLLTTVGTVVDGQRESVARDQMEVVGQQIVADLGTADRLAAAGAEEVVVRNDHQRRVAGGGYTVTVNASAGNVTLVLESGATDATVRVPVANRTAIPETQVRGGTLEIAYDADELEVRRA